METRMTIGVAGVSAAKSGSQQITWPNLNVITWPMGRARWPCSLDWIRPRGSVKHCMTALEHRMTSLDMGVTLVHGGFAETSD